MSATITTVNHSWANAAAWASMTRLLNLQAVPGTLQQRRRELESFDALLQLDCLHRIGSR